MRGVSTRLGFAEAGPASETVTWWSGEAVRADARFRSHGKKEGKSE